MQSNAAAEPTMELHEALGQISEIRAQVARTQTFGGFRSFTVASSGALGILGALYQASQIPRPMDQIGDYVLLWSAVAALNLFVVGLELAARSTLRRRLTTHAIRQFVPSLVTGAALTAVIVFRAPETAWMLPGLWSLLFGLGVFASSRLLPQPIVWVGVYYLLAGSLCLTFGKDGGRLSPWMMAATFGFGQLFAALILYCTLERGDEEVEA
jgi:hypothetical protein